MRASYPFWFLTTAMLALGAAFAFNVFAEWYILETPNGLSLETVSGFERVLKPAWLNATRPQVVAVGSSRVRDAFDPVLIAKMTGLRLFNYGISSTSAYETRRSVQDAAAHPGVTTVLVSLDAFQGGDLGQSGFDETRLAVTANGNPTPRRDLWLFITRYLSGGALGMHAQSLYLLSRLRSGEAAADRPDLFDAYAYMTPDVMARDLKHRRERTMRMSESGQRQLRALLHAVCSRDVKLILYFPPDRFEMQRLFLTNDPQGLIAFKAAVSYDARQHNHSCRSRVSVFDFMIKSQLTADQTLRGESMSYVDLIHVRPPTGLRLLNTMLYRPGAEPALGRELVSGSERAIMANRKERAPAKPGL